MQTIHEISSTGALIKTSISHEPADLRKAINELKMVYLKHLLEFQDLDIDGGIEDAISDAEYVMGKFQSSDNSIDEDQLSPRCGSR